MILNFKEKTKVAKNVYTLLKKFGGVWITPDITFVELGIDSFQRDIAVQSGTEDNTYSRIVPLKITNNVEDGTYLLTVNVYSDDG